MEITDHVLIAEQRCKLYKFPNKYIIQLPIVYKDVHSIEIHECNSPNTIYY